MIPFDFHAHSLFSSCGIHTVLELLGRAREIGMAGMSITDHGPAIEKHMSGVFFERFQNPYDDIVLLKGVEANVIAKVGATDIPPDLLKFMDIVLLGLHYNFKPGAGDTDFTTRLCRCIEDNPAIDIITHPNDDAYDIDFRKRAECAAAHEVALELNNSKTALRRVSDDVTRKLISACRDAGCHMAVNSDAHAVTELGRDENVRPLLVECDFPENMIVNRDADAAQSFVENRRSRKR